ncbi:MAG: TIM44-like domain-containing protein [Hydrogenophaga sp.]|uniref:Tim44 domain-containing protein n=1 Tax=Hydrogenophaga sp. TaxID=1904254 RepID=UPI001DEB535B|nr:TIM44-like domain-containing protein [Hydrogenophaga sp.]MBX3609298.1 TIM44-like domain-containing protein [Hydrogenophaga sp.]
MNKVWSMVLALALAMGSADVLAKRLGGGLSFGKQSTNVTQQRNTAPSQPSAPASQAAPAKTAPSSTATRPASTTAPAAPQRPWAGMLTGLAAGLGLAWLASALGFGEAFAQFLLIALVAMAVLTVVRLLTRRRSPVASPQAAGGLAYQATVPVPARAPVDFEPTVPRTYSPQNVGNDASARPWERTSPAGLDAAVAGQPGSMIGSALLGRQSWGIPAGFDAEGFLKASKANFIGLQDAWDRADIPALRAMMTDDMLAQIQGQLAERERASTGEPNRTDVVMLEAQLLGIEELDDDFMASVEFSGLIREEASAGPSPFREVWNITRPKAGPGGWLVAGVQALQ